MFYEILGIPILYYIQIYYNMAVQQILDENNASISENYLSEDVITKKVKLGDGLHAQEDGRIHTLNTSNSNAKVEKLENRIKDLEEYISYLKETCVIEFTDGSKIPED